MCVYIKSIATYKSVESVFYVEIYKPKTKMKIKQIFPFFTLYIMNVSLSLYTVTV